MNGETRRKDNGRPARRDQRRVLGIAGSPRKHGNSAILLAKVLDELGGECRTETVFLVDCDIRPCEGCHYCESHGSCRIRDDMSDLHRRLLGADAVLLAAPAYMGGLASRMQAFMERTWPLRKGQMVGKVGSYVVAGRRRPGMATGVMEAYFTRLGMTKLPGVLGFAFEPGGITQDQEAVDQTRRLARDVRNHLGLTEKHGV